MRPSNRALVDGPAGSDDSKPGFICKDANAYTLPIAARSLMFEASDDGQLSATGSALMYASAQSAASAKFGMQVVMWCSGEPALDTGVPYAYDERIELSECF